MVVYELHYVILEELSAQVVLTRNRKVDREGNTGIPNLNCIATILNDKPCPNCRIIYEDSAQLPSTIRYRRCDLVGDRRVVPKLLQRSANTMLL